MSLLPVLQHHGISFTWATEGKLIHGLKGFRKLQDENTGSNNDVVIGGAFGGEYTGSYNGIAIGGAFGNGFASANVVSTGGRGGAFGNADTKGSSSSNAEKPSGEKVMTDSYGRGPAEASASVNSVDETFSSGYGNVQNSGYGASVSVTGDTPNSVDDVVEDLTAETSKDIPFFGIFGGFGKILKGGSPDESTSVTSIPEEDASGGTSDTETVIVEGDSSETVGTAENTEEEGMPVASESRSPQSDGGYYGSFGASP
jgi:hypothetical protein